MALENYANLPSTTVSSGGTTAPASGTTETWTVASSSSFPAASNSATPPTQFHVADVAANSEMIAVTNVSGTTWTVTRGAESTTPVAHSAGFSIFQVTTAGGLGSFPAWYNVRSPVYGAKGDGSTNDTTAIQAALTAASAAGGGTVYIPAGTYKVSNLTVDTAVTLAGEGPATILSAVGGSSGYMITQKTAASSKKILLRDFALVPNTGTLGGIQLDATGFGTGDVQHQVRGVFVTNSGGDAFNFGANLRGCIISGCSQYGSEGYGYNISAGATDNFFTDCVSGPSKQHGFYVSGGNNLIKGCKAFWSGYDTNGASWGTTQAAFYLNSATYVTMVGCSAQQAALHGIDMQGAQYCTVTGCEADTNSAGNGVTTGVGINTNGCTNCAVIGNSGGNNGGISPGAQLWGYQVAGTQTGTVLIGNSVTGSSGIFNYVSGGGYMNIESGSVDISSNSTFVKVPSLQFSNDGLQSFSSNSGTILTNTDGHYGIVPVSATGTLTGFILERPSGSWSQITIINEGSGTIQFAASGTSHVAAGTGLTLAALQARVMTYDGSTSLWY